MRHDISLRQIQYTPAFARQPGTWFGTHKARSGIGVEDQEVDQSLSCCSGSCRKYTSGANDALPVKCPTRNWGSNIKGVLWCSACSSQATKLTKKNPLHLRTWTRWIIYTIHGWSRSRMLHSSEWSTANSPYLFRMLGSSRSFQKWCDFSLLPVMTFSDSTVRNTYPAKENTQLHIETLKFRGCWREVTCMYS